MNLPNKLTMLRMALIPLFVWLLMYFKGGSAALLAAVVFIIASLTDLLDGQIARKRNLVTTFGKLMDPLADKLLVMSALLCMVELRLTASYLVIIILAREFLVTSIRLVAAGEGIVIAADRWGKIKTVLQMTWIIATLLWQWVENSQILYGAATLERAVWVYIILQLLAYSATLMTVLSGINYFVKNKDLILTDM